MPTVIVVSGPPATGKSTLARHLAEHLRLPLLGRDTIKEALFDTLGWHDRAESKRLGAAAAAVLFAQLDTLARVGVDCVVESNFRRTHSSTDFQRLITDTGARIVQVQFVADGPVLFERFAARAVTAERHPGHGDTDNLDEFRAELLAGRYEPLDVPGEVLTVDTTDPAAVSIPDLARRVSALLDPTPSVPRGA